MSRRKFNENSEREAVKNLLSSLPERLRTEAEREIETEFGRIDVIIRNKTKHILIEAKVGSKSVLKSALGQLLFYKTAFPKSDLYIYWEKEIPTKYMKVFEKYGIRDLRRSINYL